MRTSLISLFLILLLFLGSSYQSSKTPASDKQPVAGPPKAICVMYPTQGNNVSGIITFTKVENGVQVVADIKGLTKGKHGMHIHECGDCSSLDASSAGGHFNPMKMNHGSPMESMRHAGDMGNIEADDQGNAHLDYIDPVMSMEGEGSIIGRSVIIHKDEDDLATQPTGNSGPRIACGVIGIAK